MIDSRVAIKIAYWYYIEGMTQEKISKKLGYSRQRVNKIVNSLVDMGVVSIVINGLEDENIQAENKIEQAFSLKQVIITNTDESERYFLPELGKRAAQFLDDYIQDGKIIGLSWGNSLSETVRNMRSSTKSGCSIVQLVGGLNTSDQSIQADEVVRVLSKKLGCECNILYAPAILDSVEVRNMLAQQDIFRKTFSLIQQCDIAIVGIGQVDESATLITHGFLTNEDLQTMRRQNYVGDICFAHFKANGDFGDIDFSSRVMGIDIDTLRKIPAVVAIAGGMGKAEAVLGALNSGCVDILITDTSVANRLLESINNRPLEVTGSKDK